MGDTVQKPDDKGTAEMSSMTTCSKKAQRPQRFNRGGSSNMDAMTSSKTAQPERATREGTAGMITMTSSMKARYRPGAKRRGVRVIPHATRLRTQLTWRKLALVAGFCLVLCLSPVVGSHKRSGRGNCSKPHSFVKLTVKAAKAVTKAAGALGATAASIAIAVKAFQLLLESSIKAYCGIDGCHNHRRLPAMECPLKEPPNIHVRRRLPVMERLLKEIEAARAKE